MKNKSLQPYLWILISGFAFSWMITFAALASRGTNWQTVALARCVIPLATVALWAWWDGAKLIVWNSPILWMRSLAGSCSLVGTFYALSFMPPTEIFTITNIFPIWVALLSWPVLGRFPSGLVWLSILSSIVGVAVIQGGELRTGNYGVLIVVGVSLLSAIAMMGLNRLKHLDPRSVVVHFSATALVAALGSLFLFPMELPSEAFHWTHWAELLGVGLSASVGQYFLTRAFTTGEPARVSVASLSQFVFVLIFDVTLVGNALDWNKLWGIPLILGPTAWLMLQRVKTSSIAPSSVAGPPRDNEPSPAVAAELAICADSAVGGKSE
ncbi:MAG: DMT family transporter [Planctomycetes bacterium]|nr:DMT family transporter [Planctomycetota bacterium]